MLNYQILWMYQNLTSVERMILMLGNEKTSDKNICKNIIKDFSFQEMTD